MTRQTGLKKMILAFHSTVLEIQRYGAEPFREKSIEIVGGKVDVEGTVSYLHTYG
jgi:hypothetical protein